MLFFGKKMESISQIFQFGEFMWYWFNFGLAMCNCIEFVKVLMKFAQVNDIFMCGYVVVVKICQVNLYIMYNDPTHFILAWKLYWIHGCCCKHILLDYPRWVTNLNGGIKHLVFCIIGQSHMLCFVDYLINIHSIII